MDEYVLKKFQKIQQVQEKERKSKRNITRLFTKKIGTNKSKMERKK